MPVISFPIPPLPLEVGGKMPRLHKDGQLTLSKGLVGHNLLRNLVLGVDLGKLFKPGDGFRRVIAGFGQILNI